MNRCLRGHYHDSSREADECDDTPDDAVELVPVVEEPLLSPEEHAAAVAEARRRLEEGRRK